MTPKISSVLVLNILIAILIPLLFWNVLSDLVSIWESKEEYSHGYMIPLVCLYFIWQKKNLILSEQFTSSWIGPIIAFVSSILFFIGTVGDVYFLLRISLILMLFSVVLSFTGIRVTKLVFIPIILLVFSFPLPPVVQAGLTAKLQLLSSQLGVSFIRACEIPVYLEGNVIDLGNYKLQVVEACSGLRYLFPLMSIAFICAYMFHVALWKRAVVFLSSIPLTVIMNSFRIGVIGVLVDNWGIEMAEGFLHDFEGWIVFMACFSILFLEMWLLSKIERKQYGWEAIFGLEVQGDEPKKPIDFSTINWKPSLVIFTLLMVNLIWIKPLSERDEFVPERRSFYQFPMLVNEWSGVSNSLDHKTVEFLGLSDYVLVDYTNKSAQSVNIYIAYYESQKNGVVPHSPKLCIPGGGWNIIDIRTEKLNQIEFNRVVIAKGKFKQIVYYWYKQRENNIANEYVLKWHTFVGSLMNNRTDGALIRLTSSINPGETEMDADSRLKDFMSLMIENVNAYVPN